MTDWLVDSRPLTAAEARRIMAGLVDPTRVDVTRGELGYLRDVAERFFCVIAKHCTVGDRTTVWSQVHKAVQSAIDNNDGGDTESLINHALRVVQPDAGRLATCDLVLGLVSESASWPPEQHARFHAYIAGHWFPLLVRARTRWKSMKDQDRAGSVKSEEVSQ